MSGASADEDRESLRAQLAAAQSEIARLRDALTDLTDACENGGTCYSPAWGDAMVALGRRYDLFGRYLWSYYDESEEEYRATFASEEAL